MEFFLSTVSGILVAFVGWLASRVWKRYHTAPAIERTPRVRLLRCSHEDHGA
jgi:hypothetical protein